MIAVPFTYTNTMQEKKPAQKSSFNKIGWCHFTINFWWGCTEISAACLNCYAREWAAYVSRKMFGRLVLWGDAHPRAERLQAARATANELEAKAVKNGTHYRIFVNSMSDTFDAARPLDWLAYLLETIFLCPHLTFLLLTKRPERMKSDLISAALNLSESESPAAAWATAWAMGNPPANVVMMTTVENRKAADERIPPLLAFPARWRALSCEPLLENLNLRNIGGRIQIDALAGCNMTDQCPTNRLDWIIAGGESGKCKIRPTHPAAYRSLRDQCLQANVPFYFKQHGNWIHCSQTPGHKFTHVRNRNPHKWEDGSESFMINEKHCNLLDGVLWQQMPDLSPTVQEPQTFGLLA